MSFSKIKCHDPFVNRWPELDLNVEISLAEFFTNRLDVLIITTGHQNYVESDSIYKHLASIQNTPLIIDTVGLLDLNKLPSAYSLNTNFFVLGVGHSEK